MMRKGLCALAKCPALPEVEGYCGEHYRRMLERWNSPVYFIRAGAYVKIGYSNNPHKRLRHILHTGAWPNILTSGEVAAGVVVATESGGPTREARLHALFRGSRVAQEWFRYSGDLKDYIEALALDPERQSRRFDRDPIFEDQDMMQLMRDAKCAHEQFVEVKHRRRVDAERQRRDRAREVAFFNARSGGVNVPQLAAFIGLNRLHVIRVTPVGEGDTRLNRWTHPERERIYAMAKQ